MLRQEVDEEDLRTEIYSLRKHITRVCSENQILKVKIRKLQDEMIRRDRQLDEFLQSKRFFGLPKNLQDKGASLLMNLKLKNDKQEQLLLEKDMTIKRLQNALQTAKLYNSNCLNKKFASKGIECILLGDNKCEYYKKGKMNNKLELHMPTFDMGDFDANGKNYKREKNVFAINRNDTNSAESQFLLDINLDLKQSTKPLFSSESRYERRRSAYHMEAKSSKSEGLLEMTSTEYIPIGGRRSNIDEYKKGEAHFDFQESVEPNGCTNPAFKKILRTIEELMAQGKYSDTNYAKTIDESVQFPCDGPEMVRRIIDSNCNNVTHETIILTTIKSNNKNFDMEANILNNEQPPCILNETQVQELSDTEEISISEKIDTMEKSEIEVEEKISTMDKEMPHEEIKQLHVFLLDMISQVDSLKDTISQMKADQEKTENDLRTKNESIEKLAKKIEELRELRSISTVDIEKLGNQLKTSVEIPEKECVTAESYDVMKKTTQQNIKKIAGKIKHLRETKSKSSISSQTQKKTTRSSSKCSKSEKKKCSEKNIRKSEKKGQEIANSQKVFGIGSGDVIEVPFYRCGFLTTSEMNRSTTKNEFDELD